MKCKNKKSPGLDNIPNEVLKNRNIILVMFKLFTFCFDNCIIPNSWLKSIIKPIPKGAGKDPYLPLNYRGISLLSCVGKLYSNILNNRLTSYLESNEILADEQNGFRKQRSCEDHLFTMSSIVRNRLKENKSTFSAFIDFSKAFDSINRELLYFKLLANNINGKLYRAIKAMYSNTVSAIRLGNLTTDWFHTESGVRQGDNLSPTLFNIYLNDLARELNSLGLGIKLNDIHVCLLLYADDIVLISENEENLQKMLNFVNEWCEKWQLNVNIEKTKIMHFRKKRKAKTNFKFYIGRTDIEIVKSYKYLGIIFDEFLTFEECASTLSSAAGRALSSIISKFKQFKNIGYDTFNKLYFTGVNSILNYGASIWGFNQDKAAQIIQNRAIRYFLGVHKNAANLAIQGDMGWLNVKYEYYICIARLWNRLIKMNTGRLTRKILEFDLQNISDYNWCGDFYQVLESINMEEYMVNGTIIDLSEFKRNMFDLMYENWSVNVCYKPKLRNYVKFKRDINTESYISTFLSRYQRSLLAQLRTGILPLHVETGRYYRTPLEQRVCKICQTDEIEDEYHFICICSIYSTERNLFFNQITQCHHNFETLDLEEKMNIIMNFNVKKLALYVEKIWNLRRTVSCI